MYAVSVLDRKILGFLDDGPLHGYELRRRITELDGPGARLSEGALYPALARLERAGLITRTARTGTGGRTRRTLTITDAGRERLHELLRSPAREEMEAMPSFLGVLAFLSHLPDAAERRAVLHRRLQILQDGPPSFFYDEDGRPRRAAVEPDPYRRGMTLIAAAARREEIAWLHRILSDDADAAGAGAAEANADTAVSAGAAEAGAGPRSTDTDDQERT